MTRSLIAAAAVLALAATAPAQTAEIQAKINRDLEAARAAERAEDLEVLRRILNKTVDLSARAAALDGACTSCHVPAPVSYIPAGHDPHGKLLSSAFGPAHGLTVPSFDAVYLAGHGVVFTLKIPASVGVVLDPVNKTAAVLDTCLKCHTKFTPPAPKAATPTEWDQTREEIRGVKPGVMPKPAADAPTCEPGRLTEQVLAKLWQNGRHVRHLPAGESLTVVVTFDGHAGPSRAGGWRSDWLSVTAPPPVRVDAAFATETAGDNIAGFTAEEARAVREGDKLMAAGKHAEAFNAYATALGRVNFAGAVLVPADKLDQWKQRFPKVIENVTRGVADVRRKFAAAAAALGDALADPESAKRFAAGAENVTLEGVTVPPPGPKVPERVGFRPDEVKQLSLGDLHLRQGQARDAAIAYERALARYKTPTAKLDPTPGLSAAQERERAATLQQDVRGLHGQLAQAWLLAGDYDKAAAALEIGRTFTATPGTKGDAAAKGVAVPAKLVLAVPKAAADGKDEAAFRKAVKVEVTGFPPAK